MKFVSKTMLLTPFEEQFPDDDGDRESTISDIARGVADREIEEESQRHSSAT